MVYCKFMHWKHANINQKFASVNCAKMFRVQWFKNSLTVSETAEKNYDYTKTERSQNTEAFLSMSYLYK